MGKGSHPGGLAWLVEGSVQLGTLVGNFGILQEVKGRKADCGKFRVLGPPWNERQINFRDVPEWGLNGWPVFPFSLHTAVGRLRKNRPFVLPSFRDIFWLSRHSARMDSSGEWQEGTVIRHGRGFGSEPGRSAKFANAGSGSFRKQLSEAFRIGIYEGEWGLCGE